MYPSKMISAIMDAAESILDAYRIPPISLSHFVLEPHLWEILAEIDLLQAGVEGGRTWRLTGEGNGIRRALASESRRLGRAVVEYGLVDASATLLDLAMRLDRFPGK